MRHLAWMTALVFVMWAPAASAQSTEPKAAPASTHLVDTPCKGCQASLPPGTDPVPLLVVLHGDRGHSPAELLSAWEHHAASRNVAVLSLQCPRDQGCNGSWWQWNGELSWVTAQVDALAAKRPIDRSRMWLAGWSGGASYMGMRAQAFQRTFAALVYHGGGIPPLEIGCGQSLLPADGGKPSPPPVYFLVGDANPLHHLAVGLRRHHERCGDEVSWNVTPHADHAAEWKLLDQRGGTIIEWLLPKRLPR
jgi:poly(3-hydroxybutyrate) depolymerase